MHLCKVFVGALFLVASFSGLHAQSLKAKKIGSAVRIKRTNLDAYLAD